jgi:hypothetical protein
MTESCAAPSALLIGPLAKAATYPQDAFDNASYVYDTTTDRLMKSVYRDTPLYIHPVWWGSDASGEELIDKTLAALSRISKLVADNMDSSKHIVPLSGRDILWCASSVETWAAKLLDSSHEATYDAAQADDDESRKKLELLASERYVLSVRATDLKDKLLSHLLPTTSALKRHMCTHSAEKVDG